MEDVMEKVYLVKVHDTDGSIHWIGKEGKSIEDPWSSELMDFAAENGFSTEIEAIESPISFYREGKTIEAEIVGLEIW